MSTTPTILQRVARGEPGATDACVSEYGGLVWRLAKRYLDHADGEIEDAVQEVFIEVWLHAKRYNPDLGTEAAFVATIAHRRIIDKQRQITGRRRAMRKMADAELAANPTRGTAGASPGADGSEIHREEISRTFFGLPESEQTALRLALYRGMSHSEISRVTEAPIGTVKSRLRRAMMRLTQAVRENPAAAGVEPRPEMGGDA